MGRKCRRDFWIWKYSIEELSLILIINLKSKIDYDLVLLYTSWFSTKLILEKKHKNFSNKHIYLLYFSIKFLKIIPLNQQDDPNLSLSLSLPPSNLGKLCRRSSRARVARFLVIKRRLRFRAQIARVGSGRWRGDEECCNRASGPSDLH